MRGIVEDVLWEGGVLTTDEICRGVKAKHAQLHALLPPRWQEEVRQILEAHCISHEGNSWFLENIEQLVRQLLEAYRSSHEGSRFLEIDLHHGTSELIINDSNRGQKRTDWASTESYRYLDLALPDMVRNVVRMPLDRARGLGPLRRVQMPPPKVEADDISNRIVAAVDRERRFDARNLARSQPVTAVKDLVFVDDNRLMQPMLADAVRKLSEVLPFDQMGKCPPADEIRGANPKVKGFP